MKLNVYEYHKLEDSKLDIMNDYEYNILLRVLEYPVSSLTNGDSRDASEIFLKLLGKRDYIDFSCSTFTTDEMLQVVKNINTWLGLSIYEVNGYKIEVI